MFTTVCYSESQDAAAAEVNMAAVVDESIKVTGDNIYIPKSKFVVGLAGFIGTTGTYAKLSSPSLKAVNPLHVATPNLVLVPGAGLDETFFPDNPVELTENEPVQFKFYADPAAAEQGSAVLFLTEGAITPVKGKTYCVRATVTLALVAGAWAYSELTFIDELPTGYYKCVGAKVVAATAVAFRFVPIGYYERPGGLVAQTAGVRDPYHQRYGRLGEWFQFNTVQPPGLQIMSSAAAASATYNVYVDIIPA